MGTFQDLLLGFSVALTPENLAYALIGCLLGTLIGVLPGIGPAAGTALLIPLTFQLPPTSAIIMLAAIYYGSQFGGTITAVLLNVPGEASSAITCIDGHQMARQGRAGVALTIAALGSFVGGTFATCGLVLAAPALTGLALQFGSPEFFALMVLGLSLVTALGGKSMVKALIMAVFGLLLGMVGMDPAQGAPRFTFGHLELLDGLDFVPVIMGLFGLSELLHNAENPGRHTAHTAITSLVPSRQDLRDALPAILRGSVIGSFLGLVPGMTGSACSFSSYIAERKFAKHRHLLGKGAIEGVAGPETANNAHANAALIPLFTLGIPGSATVAVLMGAFMMNGLIPGPFLFVEHPDVVWGVIASLYLGNLILLVLNIPLVGIWVNILRIPYATLMAIVLAFMALGAYAVNNSAFDVGVMLVFGVLGYVLVKLEFPLAPVALTLILGPVMERSLRRSLEMSQGDFGIFLTSPIATGLLVLSALIVLATIVRPLVARRKPYEPLPLGG